MGTTSQPFQHALEGRGRRYQPLALVSAVATATLAAIGCIPDQTPLPEEEAQYVLVVDPSTRHQRIRGFGASSAWTAPTLSEDQAELLFSVDEGIGLSLLRIQIKPDGTTTELGAVDAAVPYGVDIWAAPWSPPGDFKDNGSTVNGGSLLPEYYDDWAQALADFAGFMDERGTPLLGVSAQNEPDYTAEWDTCRYTPEELATFIGDYLAPALAELRAPVPVIAPEAANWNSFDEYGEAILDYEPAANSILAYATHGYAGFAWEFERVRDVGGEIWLTEISDPEMDAPDVGMGSALRVFDTIHSDLVYGFVSAWHYWWLFARADVEDTNAALFDRDYQPTKRAFALGHFSKFLRPGARRLEATPEPRPSMVSSAYLSDTEEEIVVVLASNRSDPIEQTIEVSGTALGEAEVWITDEDRSLQRTTTSRADGDELVVSVPPRSVVTVVVELD